MNTFLLTWNPARWNWGKIQEAVATTLKGELHSERWSCNTKKIHIGDRIFLIKLGEEPRGLIASGYVTSELYASEHWDEEKRAKGIPVQRVNIDFDVVLDSHQETILYMDELMQGKLSEQHWSSQTSGIKIAEDIAEIVEVRWKQIKKSRRKEYSYGIDRSQVVLSLPASGTYELVTDTLVHAHPVKPAYNYKYTDLITFRKKSGVMERVYSVDKIIEINPHKELAVQGLSNIEQERLQKYIDIRSNTFLFKEPTAYRFYLLREKYSFKKPFVLSPNHQGYTYYTIQDIAREIGVDSIHEIDVKNEYELSEQEQEQLIEGAKKQIVVNAYERNGEARRKCIEHYGTSCMVCGFDAGAIYGEEFEGMIHVHHIKPLNEIGTEYVVDPIQDLVPVCPNCHMILHSTNNTYTLEELKIKTRGNL